MYVTINLFSNFKNMCVALLLQEVRVAREF